MPQVDTYTFKSPQLKDVLGGAVDFFLSRPFSVLPPDFRFNGPGVYGLYYSGNFELYEKLSQLNNSGHYLPIYIGKAVPPGWRTARIMSTDEQVLHRRLREHVKSISRCSNLDVADFKCKFVILNGLESGLIVPLEAELIRKYTPLWNSIVDGFGNHDPGSGRYGQAKSEWDIVHPGRIWVDRLTGASPIQDNVHSKIETYTKKL